MKTERRHELQHNELADQLALLIERARPYGRAIGAAVLLLIVAIAFFAIQSSNSARRNAAGWDEYYAAFNQGSEEQLNEVAKKYPGTPVGEWSKLIASDILLGQGVDQLFSDKAAGKTKLQDAAEGYQSVLLNAKTGLVKQRALFGLARAYESRGELPKAREQYEQLVKDFPDSAFAPTAQSRVKELETDSAKKFYDWFASYEPPRTPGTPGQKPLFDLPGDIDANGALPTDIKLNGSLPTTDSLLEGSSDPGDKPAEDNTKESEGEGKAGDAKAAEADPPANPAADQKADEPQQK